MELVLAGTFSFPDKAWNTISPLAKDFIKRLLKSDPKARLTAKEAMNHPWLFLGEIKKKIEKKEKFIQGPLNKKKHSILTISALRNRIPSIDDIDLDVKTPKPAFSKFKEKLSVRALDLHVHTIENKKNEFRIFSPQLKMRSENMNFGSNLLLKRRFKTGKSIENDTEEEEKNN